MVDLKNWEFFANTGAAVIGATVTPYVASDTHPNPNAAAAAAVTTNGSGKWEFSSALGNALADGNLYDIKVEYGSGKVKWYKGNAKLTLGHLYDDTQPAVDRNILPNGGQQSWSNWSRNGGAAITMGSGTEIADHWLAYVSGGDSGTATRAVPAGINAQYCTQFNYTRVGGNLQYLLTLPQRYVKALAGKTVAFAISVYQTTDAKLYAVVNDGVGESASATTSTTGTWTTIWVTRAISASATSILVGIRTGTPAAGAYVLYTCNAALIYGSTQPVYALNATELGGDVNEGNRLVGLQSLDQNVVTAYSNTVFLSEALNFFTKRLKEVIGGANWYDAVPATLTSLLAAVNLKAPLASPTFTGTLNAATGAFSNAVSATQFQSTLATGTAPLTVNSTTKVTNLNADLLDGSDSTAFAGASHGHNVTKGNTTGDGTNGRSIATGISPSVVLVILQGSGFATIGVVTPNGTVSVNKNGATVTMGESTTDKISGSNFSISATAMNLNNNTYDIRWFAWA